MELKSKMPARSSLSENLMSKVKIRSLKILIARRKKIIALIAVWGFLIALVMIKSHWLYYLANRQFSVYTIPWRVYEGPKFNDLDLALLLITSFLIGIFVTDVKHVVYGYFSATFLSVSVTTIYIVLYNRLVLTLGERLTDIPFGWEWEVSIAFLNVFRFIFPIGIICCLIGLIVGIFAKIWLRPYA
jgi:hypothetical protein